MLRLLRDTRSAGHGARAGPHRPGSVDLFRAGGRSPVRSLQTGSARPKITAIRASQPPVRSIGEKPDPTSVTAASSPRRGSRLPGRGRRSRRRRIPAAARRLDGREKPENERDDQPFHKGAFHVCSFPGSNCLRAEKEQSRCQPPIKCFSPCLSSGVKPLRAEDSAKDSRPY